MNDPRTISKEHTMPLSVEQENRLRFAVVDAARRLLDARLNSGTAGNVSVRFGDEFLISPSGLHPHQTAPADVVVLRADGSYSGRRAPSSEWPFHLDLYAARTDIAAIIHTHSPFATTLACQRREIPPFHYTVARFGGNTVRCAGYAAFGSKALSLALQDAMRDRRACLMANHGAAVMGRSVEEALDLAFELELLSELYWRSLQGGPPVLLSEAEMADVRERYRSYGRQPPLQDDAGV
jgi:L-fuculose-phosphate aldolase